MKIFKYKIKAFSLIEVLLYISLLCIILTGIVTFSNELFLTSNKAKIINNVDYESNYALNLISSYIQEAKIINSPTTSSSSPILSFNYASNTTIIISLINNQISMSVDNNPPISLTSNKVKITNLTFTNLGLLNTKGLIKISFTADNNTTSEKQEFNFTNNYETYATPKN